MTDKEKIELKRKLVEQCIVLLHQSAEVCKNEMEEHQRMANEYGPPKDRYDSFRTQMLRKRDMYAVQYQKIKDDILLMDRIKKDELEQEVSFGSVVISNNQNLFISIGLGKIIIDGNVYYAVSPQVPVAIAVLNKKKGERVHFNGKQIMIIDVF
jgi:hypothetical protein